jgi:hypothetical protein
VTAAAPELILELLIYADTFVTVTNTSAVLRDGAEHTIGIVYRTGTVRAELEAADGSGVVWFDDGGSMGKLKSSAGADMATAALCDAVDAGATFTVTWSDDVSPGHPELRITAIIMPEPPAPEPPPGTTVAPSSSPAPLVPAELELELVDLVAGRVATELNVADGLETRPHAAAALELIATELDRPYPYPTIEQVPVRVVLAAVIVECDLYRRPGFAFGAIGIGESGTTVTAGRDPLGSVRGMLAGARARWGLA